jgi:hypothetical protein
MYDHHFFGQTSNCVPYLCTLSLFPISVTYLCSLSPLPIFVPYLCCSLSLFPIFVTYLRDLTKGPGNLSFPRFPIFAFKGPVSIREGKAQGKAQGNTAQGKAQGAGDREKETAQKAGCCVRERIVRGGGGGSAAAEPCNAAPLAVGCLQASPDRCAPGAGASYTKALDRMLAF